MLEGRLDDFSLPDIFQLLALTRKTGTLRVRYGDTEGQVVFREGQVVAATGDARHTAPGARMLAAGLISAEQLEAAIEAREEQGGVVEALVAHGAVAEEDVSDFRSRQAEDAVFSLMRLTGDAGFTFDTGKPASVAGEVRLSTEELVVEGGRRLAEWNEIRQRVPSRDAIIAMVADPLGDGQLSVSRDQWRLLSLIDGRRSVGDVVTLLGAGEFTTVAQLAALVDAGLIVVGAVGDDERVTALRSRGEKLRELEARELGMSRARARQAAKKHEGTLAPTLKHGVELDGDYDPEVDDTADEPRGQPVVMAPPAPPSRDNAPDQPAEADAAATASPDDHGPDDSVLQAVGELMGEVTSDDAGSDAEATDAEATDGDVDAAASDAPTGAAAPGNALTRDQDINKAMLLRLIDGVKGV